MVFEDPTRLRWRTALAVFIVICLLGGLLSVVSLISLFVAPPFPAIPSGTEITHALSRIVEEEQVHRVNEPSDGMRPRWDSTSFVRSAFLVQGDPLSVSELKHHAAALDAVFPDWFTMSTDSGELREEIDPVVVRWLAGSELAVLPRLSNTDTNGIWRGEEFGVLLEDEDARTKLTATLVQRLQALHVAGVNIDIEALNEKHRSAFVDWIEELATACHEHQLAVTVDVPVNDATYDYEALGSLADAVIVMAYDEHYAGGEPGSVAGQEWFVDSLDAALAAVPTNKLVMAFGAYGYDWNVTHPGLAEALGFTDLMLLADDMGATPEVVTNVLNGAFTYQAPDGAKHAVWFCDAITGWNQYLTARAKHVRGVALWRLGLEDPSLWTFWGHDLAQFNPATLSTVPLLDGVALEGSGDLFRVKKMARVGERELSLDGALVDYAIYRSLPLCSEVEKFGRAPDKVVALTFDDGPDGRWTPEVLDTLRQYGVRATFFLVGDQAQRFPQLVHREWAEGHLLGNHTFFHPNIQTISDARLNLELNATERTIEALIGRQMLFFRSPYDADTEPVSPHELARLYNVSQRGYICAGADVDSADYMRPGTDVIVDAVWRGVSAPGTHIVVMHDAGGFRQQTVAALRVLIPHLIAAGYRFVTLNELVPMTRAAAMPSISWREKWIVTGHRVYTVLRTSGWRVVVVLFFLTTIISVIRIITLGFFVFSSHRQQRYSNAEFTPPVAVLVPAHNEATVISRTLAGLLASDYPHLQVLVIDDGSTDATGDLVRDAAKADPRVHLLSKPNAGKSAALNDGLQAITEDFVVTIDADTIVLPQTIRQLIVPFTDPAVGGVCGNVQVGNICNLLTAFQNVEYVTSQNYDRRAFDAMNCIGVVPGATGAWRRHEVLAAGGYSDETLTEDADLTLTLLTRGVRIVYAAEARSLTEAPQHLRALFRQRFRWSYGTFQCLWRHRHQFGKGSLGWIALPNLLLFQVVLPVLSPIGDLVLVLSLLRGDFGAVAMGYTLFLIMDLAGSLIAFTLERRPWWEISVVLIQRFCYRQFMYIVTLQSMFAVMRGNRQRWHKMDRHISLPLATPV